MIGCGAIGTVIAKAVDKGVVSDATLLAVFDRNRERSEKLVSELTKKPIIAESFNQLIKEENVSFVIEAASQEAVRQYAVDVLKSGKDLMVMSVGALVDEALLQKIKSAAREANKRVYIPSGAIAGLDAVKAASLTGLSKVVLTTIKPVKSLEGAPYLKQHKINLSAIKKRRVIYKGQAEEAVKMFPANINVAATLSLAGIGPKRTLVQIVADPRLTRIVHRVSVEGEFGKFRSETVNVPCPTNPKTSYLAALSAIRTLVGIAQNFIIGT
jgi:aspartate dehydrogenase